MATCRLLITFATSLEPVQDRQNVGPDLDPNCLTLIVFLKEFFFDKVNFEESRKTTIKVWKITQHVELIGYSS